MKRRATVLHCLFIAACTAGALAAPARAESFPERTVKLVVPYPISGPTDIRGTSRMTKTYKLIAQHAPPPISDTLAQMVAQALRAGSRHAVVLERQPGASTTRGTLAVARAPADGHTLLLASNATMVINPNYFHDVPYDPIRDFVLVAPLATMPFVLLVNAALPVDSAQKLAGWVRARPGEINYGSSGDGSTGHLAGELFRKSTGVNMVHVSYNGGLAALNGLATGQVSVMFAALPLVLPYLVNEHFKTVGVAARSRLALVPDLPTLAESGVTGLEIEAWYGVFAPNRIPPAARVWLTEQISTYMSTESIRMALLESGLNPPASTLSEFATRIHTETEKWAPVLRASRAPLKGRDAG